MNFLSVNFHHHIKNIIMSRQISDPNNACIKNEESEEQIEESQGQRNDLLRGYISVPVKQETKSEGIPEDQHGDSKKQKKSIVDRLKFENNIDDYEVDAAMRTISFDAAPTSCQPVKQETIYEDISKDQHGDSEISEPVKQETNSEGIPEDQHGNSKPVKQDRSYEAISEDQHGETKLVIYNVRLLQRQRLENALHPKKRCKWQPSRHEPPSSPSDVASCSVPSLAKFEKRQGCASLAPYGAPRCPLNSRDEDINYGSEPESDESDDEDDVFVNPVIPRVFRAMTETPLDQDSDDEDAPADTAPASGLESAEVPVMMTEQPWSPYHFDWRKFPNPPIPPESRREPFSVTYVGPTTPSTDPYQIFTEIWDLQIMAHIASATNKYAQQVAAQLFDNHSLNPTSRISKWQDTTVDELYVYFGIILAMGIVFKSRFEEYWSSTVDIFYSNVIS